MSWPAGWTSSPPIARGLITKTSCRNYSLGDAWRTGNAPRWLRRRRRGSPSRTQRHVYQTRRHRRRRAGRAGDGAAAADDAAKDIDLEVSSSPRASAFKRIFCAKAPKCVIA